MSKTKEMRETTSMSNGIPVLWRSEEPWPRMMQWLDTWFPADVAWRTHPHSLRVEEIHGDDALTLRIEFPGVDPDKDIDVTVDNGHLTVSGRRREAAEAPHRSEFYYGEFLRSIPLPSGVDEGSVSARYADGILEITMGMTDGHKGQRHIPIAHSSPTE